MYEKTLDLGNDYRVNVILDEFAEKPFDEGAAPIVSYNWRFGTDAVNSAGEDYSGYIGVFLEKYNNDYELLERALKIVYGITHLELFDTQDATYFAFDPQEWADDMGIESEYRKDNNVVEGTAKEYEAWVNGECFGIVVEQKITGQKRYNDGRVEDFTEWEELESLWGFYGDWILEDKNLRETAHEIAGLPTFASIYGPNAKHY